MNLIKRHRLLAFFAVAAALLFWYAPALIEVVQHHEFEFSSDTEYADHARVHDRAFVFETPSIDVERAESPQEILALQRHAFDFFVAPDMDGISGKSALGVGPNASSAPAFPGMDAGCPDRYLYMSPMAWGRHHNQLQIVAHAMAWQKLHRRTVILGPFFQRETWVSFTKLYDPVELRKKYCVVTWEDFQADWAEKRKRLGERSTDAAFSCAGPIPEDAAASVIASLFPGSTVPERCTRLPVPGNFRTPPDANATQIAFSVFERMRDFQAPRLMLLTTQVGFWATPGLVPEASVFRRLLPSAEVRAEIAASKHKTNFGSGPFGAIHMRAREGSCITDFKWRKLMSRQRMLDLCRPTGANLGARARSLTERHVALPHADRAAFDHSDQAGWRSGPVQMFFAHDGQRPTLAAEVAKASRAVVFPSVMKAKKGDPAALERMLRSFAAEFFTLVDADVFVGNPLSSVTQNACYARLGRGKPCHGMPPTAFLHFARVSGLI